MRGHISKESWSRCEQPSMLYDTVRNPNAPRTPPRPSLVLPSSKDTIETVQQRLNREMLQRLHSKGRFLPHESFVAVVQIGKYLFLAVMLPPYLCFYAIPKWLLVQMLPQIAEAAKQIIVRWGAFVIEFSKKVADLMKGMIDQTIGWALRSNKDRFQRAAQKIAAFVNRVAKTVGTNINRGVLAFKDLKDKFDRLIRSFPERLRSLGEKAFENFKSAGEMVAASVARLTVKIAKALQAPLQTGAKTVFGPMNIAYSQASRQVEAVKQYVVSVVTRALSPIVQPLAEAVVATYRLISAALERAVAPTVEKFKESFEKVITQAAKGRKVVEEVVKVASSAVQSAAAVVFAAVADQVRYAWQIVPNMFAWIGKRSRERLPRKLVGKLEGKREAFKKLKGAAGHVVAGAGRGVKEVVAFAGKGVASGLGMIGHLLKMLKKLIAWSLLKLVMLPKYLLKVLGRTANAIGNVLKGLGFAMQVFIAFMWAVCLYGAYLLNYTGNRLLTPPIQR